MDLRLAIRARRARFTAAESLGPLSALALVFAGFVYDAFFDPVGGAVTCPILRVTGVPCPTCGMTRSFVALGNGELGLAFAAHPLGPVLVLFLVATFAAWALRVVLNRPPARRVWVRRAWWALGLAIAILGAARALGVCCA